MPGRAAICSLQPAYGRPDLRERLVCLSLCRGRRAPGRQLCFSRAGRLAPRCLIGRRRLYSTRLTDPLTKREAGPPGSDRLFRLPGAEILSECWLRCVTHQECRRRSGEMSDRKMHQSRSARGHRTADERCAALPRRTPSLPGRPGGGSRLLAGG